MKRIFTFLLTMALFISCSSVKNIEQDDYSDDDYGTIADTNISPETSDSFLGDFDPIRLQDLMFLQKSGKTVKPKEVKNAYLVPRANVVEMCFRDGVNVITFAFNKAERKKILDACNTFLQQYEAREVPHQKVNANTAYVKSKTPLWFGVISSENGCTNNDYYVNCEFIDKKPYLLIKFVPSRTDKGDTFTPKLSLYMSPSQIREFMEVLKQENLEEKVKELNAKAYNYE